MIETAPMSQAQIYHAESKAWRSRARMVDEGICWIVSRFVMDPSSVVEHAMNERFIDHAIAAGVATAPWRWSRHESALACLLLALEAEDDARQTEGA